MAKHEKRRSTSCEVWRYLPEAARVSKPSHGLRESEAIESRSDWCRGLTRTLNKIIKLSDPLLTWFQLPIVRAAAPIGRSPVLQLAAHLRRPHDDNPSRSALAKAADRCSPVSRSPHEPWPRPNRDGNELGATVSQGSRVSPIRSAALRRPRSHTTPRQCRLSVSAGTQFTICLRLREVLPEETADSLVIQFDHTFTRHIPIVVLTLCAPARCSCRNAPEPWGPLPPSETRVTLRETDTKV
jgi:hypothetical protein